MMVFLIILLVASNLFAGDFFKLVKIKFNYKPESGSILYFKGGKCLDEECREIDESKVIFYKDSALKCLYDFHKYEIDKIGFELCLKMEEIYGSIRIESIPNRRLLLRLVDGSENSRYIAVFWTPDYIAYAYRYTILRCGSNYCMDEKVDHIHIKKLTPKIYSLWISDIWVQQVTDEGIYVNFKLCGKAKNKTARWPGVKKILSRWNYYTTLYTKFKVIIIPEGSITEYYKAEINIRIREKFCKSVRLIIEDKDTDLEPLKGGYMLVGIEDPKAVGFTPMKVSLSR